MDKDAFKKIEDEFDTEKLRQNLTNDPAELTSEEGRKVFGDMIMKMFNNQGSSEKFKKIVQQALNDSIKSD